MSIVMIVIAGIFAWKHAHHRVEGVLVSLRLGGALVVTPMLIRKLLPARPLFPARRLAGDTSPEPRGWVDRFEAAAFRRAVSKALRAILRRWRTLLPIGAALVALAFVVDAASVALAVAMLGVGTLLVVFGTYGMLAPRRFLAPLPSETEIVSPLMLVGNPRGEALLGIFGFLCVLASFAIDFVRLYV